jgi:hypothetical protein
MGSLLPPAPSRRDQHTRVDKGEPHRPSRQPPRRAATSAETPSQSRGGDPDSRTRVRRSLSRRPRAVLAERSGSMVTCTSALFGRSTGALSLRTPSSYTASTAIGMAYLASILPPRRLPAARSSPLETEGPAPTPLARPLGQLATGKRIQARGAMEQTSAATISLVAHRGPSSDAPRLLTSGPGPRTPPPDNGPRSPGAVMQRAVPADLEHADRRRHAAPVLERCVEARRDFRLDAVILALRSAPAMVTPVPAAPPETLLPARLVGLCSRVESHITRVMRTERNRPSRARSLPCSRGT